MAAAGVYTGWQVVVRIMRTVLGACRAKPGETVLSAGCVEGDLRRRGATGQDRTGQDRSEAKAVASCPSAVFWRHGARIDDGIGVGVCVWLCLRL